MKVFVYGTLMQGFGNHRLISGQGGRFVGEAVLAGYEMFSFGGFPGIRLTSREDSLVRGEVWEIEDIAPLDYLEGHPRFYLRTSVVVRPRVYATGVELPLTVETYVPTEQYGYPTITSGSWREVTGKWKPRELETVE